MNTWLSFTVRLLALIGRLAEAKVELTDWISANKKLDEQLQTTMKLRGLFLDAQKKLSENSLWDSIKDKDEKSLIEPDRHSTVPLGHRDAFDILPYVGATAVGTSSSADTTFPFSR